MAFLKSIISTCMIYLISKKYANVTFWDFRMLIASYMSIIEQIMSASEQK